MRGKVPPEVYPIIRHGITPAYAGKSLLLCFGRAPVEDHPRLCGEKFCLDSPPLNSTGSPPPMRGKDFPHFPAFQPCRITPAYAGKSLKKPQNASSY